MILSILIPTLASRSRNMFELVAELTRQAQILGLSDDEYEVLINIDNGEVPSGRKRQSLLDAARGDYVAFFDDDDRPSPRYVESIVDAIRSRQPDVVTFGVERRGDRGFVGTQWFWLGGADNRKLPDGSVEMQANHLMAWRREIARTVAWPQNLGYGDDQVWYQTLAIAIAGQDWSLNEAHIHEPLYYYHWSAESTANQTQARMAAAMKWQGDGLSVAVVDGVYVAAPTWPAETMIAGRFQIR